MMRHWRTRRRLYDYLRGELTAPREREAAAHLAACSRCRREADELRALLGALGDSRPSDERPASYWDAFADAVDRRIDAAGPARTALKPRFGFPYRREVFAFAGGVAAVLVAFALWKSYGPAERPQEARLGPLQAEQTITPVNDTTAERMRQYFRRSRVLLIGMANLEPEEEGPFTAERRTSRELIQEARYLQSRPMDERGAKLISDMETILIELANLEESQGMPNVDLIRSGIHRENLLFKIRMAEETYGSPQVLAARHTTERE